MTLLDHNKDCREIALYTPFELPLTLVFSNCVVTPPHEIIKCNLTTFLFVCLRSSVITLEEQIVDVWSYWNKLVNSKSMVFRVVSNYRRSLGSYWKGVFNFLRELKWFLPHTFIFCILPQNRHFPLSASFIFFRWYLKRPLSRPLYLLELNQIIL